MEVAGVDSSHLSVIAIGIGATLVMDLWNLFLKRTFSIPSLNYCLGVSERRSRIGRRQFGLLLVGLRSNRTCLERPV